MYTVHDATVSYDGYCVTCSVKFHAFSTTSWVTHEKLKAPIFSIKIRCSRSSFTTAWLWEMCFNSEVKPEWVINAAMKSHAKKRLDKKSIKGVNKEMQDGLEGYMVAEGLTA